MNRILKDILTETKNGRTKYSIGRICLFVSLVGFFVLNIALGIGVISGAIFEDDSTMLVVSENMRWALGTFGLYVLGGKGIGAFRDSKSGISNDYTHETQNPPGGHYRPPHHHHQSETQDPVVDPASDNSDEDHFYGSQDQREIN